MTVWDGQVKLYLLASIVLFITICCTEGRQPEVCSTLLLTPNRTEHKIIVGTKNVILRCSCADRLANATWKFNNESIIPQEGAVTAYDSLTKGDVNIAYSVAILNIREFSIDVPSKYVCHHDNEISPSVAVNISLIASPRVTIDDEVITHLVMDHSGERLNIYCSMFMSNPSPCHECHWHRVLYNKSHYSDLSSGNNLDLRHTLTVEDGGYYTCSYDKDVRVFNYTFPVLIAPVITTNPVDQEVSIFNSFTINCTAKGSPIPSILWYLNNDLITNTDNRIIISTTTITQHSVTSTLTISSARYTDAGVYYCQTDGDNLSVEAADISRYNSEIKYQNKISDSRLSVVSHSATVTVVARLNHVSRWLRQSPDCPDRPINVQLFGVTSRGLFIDWTEPRDNNAPVTGYNITYQNPDCLVMAPNNQPQDVTVSSMERQAMIPDLHPGENYSFIVIAINDICASVPSIPVSVRTMEEAPAVAPMVATLVPTTTTISVTWNELACQDRRGVIVHYEVRYNTSDFNEDRSLTLNTTLGDDTSLLIEDLEEFGNYTIEVRAHIAAGASPYNSPMNVQTLPDIPSGPVTDLDVRNIDPTTVELSWGPVMAREQNGIILSYNIYYRQYDSISNDYFMITNITEMELNITDLNESQLYTIEVTANNQAGESDVNATIMIMTNESTPATTVQNIRIVNLTDPVISVVFTWDPPSDPNGFIRYYRVEFQEISDGSSGGRRKRVTPINTVVMNAFTNFTGPGEALTNITLDNLVAYQMYRYSVFAATSVGEGPPLDGTFITREDTPLAPNHLTVNYPGMPRNSTTLVVSWDRPSCDQGVLSGYELCYVPTSVGDCVSNGIRVNITSPDTLWYTINDLSVNTNYAVEVRGRTGAGLGDPITAVNSTDEDAPTLVMNLRAVFTAGNDTRGVYTITWTPPAASNGSYYQQFSYSFTSAYTVGPQYNGTISERIEQGVNQHVIPDAFYFSDYTFTITTINIKYSTNNGPVQIQNQSSPAAPTAVRDLEAVPSSLTSIYLIWKHPEYPNSQLTQYIIYYRANPSVIQMFPGISSDDFNVSLSLSFPMTRYYLTGLSVFTNYSIHLSVMGNSVPNAPIEHEILERTNTSGIPDVIPGDDIKQINNTVTTIVVEWPVPNYYDVSTTKYQLILCQKTNIDDCTGSVNLTVDASGSDTIERYNITGLTPFTVYQLSISAVNEIGSSPFSSQVPIRTINAMEAAVQGLNVTAYNNSEVTVTWMVPEYSELQDFVIMYFVKPKQAEMTIVDRPPYQLSDLIPGETYTVRVTSRYFNYINNIIAEADASEETITVDEIVTRPVISEQPMDQTVIPTRDVNFTCIGQACGDVKVRWFRGPHDNPLVDKAIVTTTIRANLITSVLTIPNVLTNDEGRYRCILTNSAGSTDSDFAQLAIAFPRPTINAHPMDVIADNGSSVTFTCEVFSYIPASLTWLHNGEVLDEDPTRIITTTITNTNIYTTTLMILNVQLPDSGCYVCNATSILSDTAMLCVIDPNIVENRNLDIITSNNQSVQFQSPFRSGNISHYKVVVVIGDLSDNTTDIPDEILLPYREALDNKLNYYVAIVGTVTNNNLTLGNGVTTSVDSVEYYYNQPLNHSQIYSYFIRVYFQCCNETVYTTSHLLSSFEITSAESTDSSDDDDEGVPLGVIVGCIVAVLVLLFTILIVLIIIPPKKSHRKKVEVLTRSAAQSSTTQPHFSNIRMLELTKSPMATIPEAQSSSRSSSVSETYGIQLVCETESSHEGSLPYIDVTVTEVVTSAGQPTTLCIESGGHPPPTVEWFKDNHMVEHCTLSDGSLYIANAQTHNSGSYTVKLTNSSGYCEEDINVKVSQPIPPKGDPAHPPVKLEEFVQHVTICRSNMGIGFYNEFKGLNMPEWAFTHHNANLLVNKAKNRYISILPYDHTRVPLEIDYTSTGSDYINASFIDGYARPCEYIATQGPLPSTFGDFWKMIWERRCSTIVMLTNLNEGRTTKCHQYWPAYGSTVYGAYRVTLKSVEPLVEYTIRVFHVKKEIASSSENIVEVHQFHYTVWPDHGIPKDGTPLLSFHKRVEKFHKRGDTPMVVHCSAGVGRSGTFIVIDTQLQKIRCEGYVDIFNNVRMLRYCRNHMVQTQNQYVFLHDVLLEAITCGDTSIEAPVQNVITQLKELESVDEHTNETLYSKQFKIFTSGILGEKIFTYTIATDPKNVLKNRYSVNLAPDVNYVGLPSTYGKSGYINASYIDGYRHNNAYIVTQGPLKGTVTEFWQMIWESKTHAIVMLSALEENGQEHCYQYWPDAGVEEYGSYTVEVLECDKPIGDWFKCQFKLSQISKPMDSRVITQFHFQNWSLDSCPEDPSSTIDMLDSIEQVQCSTGNGAITVHCNNGVGRSGAFCALMYCLNQFKAEQKADIFQTVKKMRTQRAGIVETLEQYEYLHKALLEAIQRYDTYSNFTL